MYSLADAFVALPGGLGTLEELAETLTWGQIGLHDKPVGLLDVAGFFAPLRQLLRPRRRRGLPQGPPPRPPRGRRRRRRRSTSWPRPAAGRTARVDTRPPRRWTLDRTPSVASALMDLPVNPPVRPMLAKALPGFDALPDGELVFEPKWDGFRCIVFRDGDEVVLGSRNDRPLTRYFPEMVEAVRRELPAALRARRRADRGHRRRRGRPQARLRHARPADPPRRQPRQHAGRRGAGQLRGVRPAGAG